MHPGGYVHLVQQGIVRARYRDAGGDEPLEPGRVYEYDIDLWCTSYVFKAGHRLRLEISSSEFDRFDRNLNVYEPWATERGRASPQTCGTTRASVAPQPLRTRRAAPHGTARAE